MTRFSEIAENIERQYDSDFDMDRSKTAPRVSFIDYWLLELCQLLDARLTALEGDKPQGTLTSPDWCRIAGERLTEIEHLTAENKQLASERKTLSSVWHALKINNERLAAEVERLAYDNANLEAGKSYWLNGSDTLLRRLNALEEQRNTLAAQVDDLTRRHESAWYAFDVAVIQNARKEHELMDERAERNALAAQVDDLRNVNAALRIALSDPAPCTGTGSGGCDCLPDDEA